MTAEEEARRLARRLRVAVIRDLFRRGWRPPARPLLDERGRDRLIADIARIGSSNKGASWQRAQNRALELTDRELQALTLAAAGDTKAEIAAKLGLSEETIRTQMAHARERLGARNTVHAVALALTRGLIELREEQAA